MRPKGSPAVLEQRRRHAVAMLKQGMKPGAVARALRTSLVDLLAVLKYTWFRVRYCRKNGTVGVGQLIGTAQSGRTDIHFADLLFDPIHLPLSRRDAFNTIAADPRLLDPAHAKLRQAVLNRFADSITLADVG